MATTLARKIDAVMRAAVFRAAARCVAEGRRILLAERLVSGHARARDAKLGLIGGAVFAVGRPPRAEIGWHPSSLPVAETRQLGGYTYSILALPMPTHGRSRPLVPGCR